MQIKDDGEHSVEMVLQIAVLDGDLYNRARVMDSILNGTCLLAHWVYSADEAEQSARREYANYQERNRAMFLVIYALHSPREAYIAENGIVYEGH